jgi:hypothetical protein
LCADPSCSKTLPFVGVQARVDSTGRANDLFRRVEARIELVDIYFPLPDYSVQANTDIVKNFWVTFNNWFGNDSGLLNS